MYRFLGTRTWEGMAPSALERDILSKRGQLRQDDEEGIRVLRLLSSVSHYVCSFGPSDVV